MDIPWSRELIVVADESRDVADQLGHELTTAHLLLCLFTVQNRAAEFLREHGITADTLLAHVKSRPTERSDEWERVLRRGREVARVGGANAVGSLHVLVALTSFVESAAYRLLGSQPVPVSRLRSAALAAVNEHTEEAVDAEHVAVPGRRRDAARTPRSVAVMAPDETAGAGPHGEPPSQDPYPPSAAPAPRPGPAEPAAAETPERRVAEDLRQPDEIRDAEEARAREVDRMRALERARRALRQTPLVGRTPIAPSPPPAAAAPGPRAATASATRTVPASQQRGRFVLREMQFPLLAKIGRNVTLEALDGRVDPVVGREREVEQLVDILNKRRANNPVLVGEPGVGKTSVVEALARRIVGLDGDAPPGVDGRIVVELDASSLISGTSIRGSFAARMQALKAEVARAHGSVVVFLDELHHWIGMGAGTDGVADAAGELKTALARGEFPCIGATTWDEYRRFIESDPAFERRFQAVRVEEPSPADALAIVRAASVSYAEHHGVSYTDDALEALVRLTGRYLPDRRLPDKALAALDLAGSRARRLGLPSVDARLSATVVAEQAGLPPEKLLMLDRERFLGLEAALRTRIVGHDTVVERVAAVLRRNHAGFVTGRPIGSFLLLGPTGVGKTELARAVAAALFDDAEALVTLDMTEFGEAHSVARLIGSPPGYVGHEAGGQLTEAIRRRPYQVVLLDEIEKAHPDVLNVLIQVLDEGRLSDARGRSVDFGSTIVMLTSNLGAEQALGRTGDRRIGFGAVDAPAPREAAVQAARSWFRPEIWNRLDETLVFDPLSRVQIEAIAAMLLTRSSERLQQERRVRYTWDDGLVAHLLERGGFEPALGARPMRRTIERLVETAIADFLLSHDDSEPASLHVEVADEQVRVRAGEATS